MTTATPSAALRPRAYVRVHGPDAVEYLNRMLSNDVPEGGSTDALLLTAKARVIAPVLVWRRADDEVLLLTEPELGEALRVQLVRMRFAARCEIEPEEHVSTVVFAEVDGIPNRDYGVVATELLDAEIPATVSEQELERLRIEARTPRYGREIDDRVLPAEAGLDERAVSFTKGCYPGQEPIARQHYRGKVNRRLRTLEVEGDPPAPETPVVHAGKEVGRVTSAVPGLALAYVRVSVPDDAELSVDGASARLH
ncbi:MAG: YgfZ/GcvT domain-containing protein [Gaiellaceae bacterium]